MSSFSAELIVAYLSSHSLLVHNESRQKEIISMYKELAGTHPEGQTLHDLEPTLPENCCTYCKLLVKG